MVTPKKILGDNAEKRAYQFLQTHGLTLITQNYRSPFGEIDLIMQDGKDVVFVEVRARKNNAFGSAIESVNRHKQRKIWDTSIHFLQRRNWLNKTNCRFDVVGIHSDQLEWIKNAFTADIYE